MVCEFYLNVKKKKKNQTEILVLKNIVTKVKSSMWIKQQVRQS